MFTDVSEGYAAFSSEDGRCLPTCLARPRSNTIYERVLLQMMVAQLDKKYTSFYAAVAFITQDTCH
jgi:hypothetical protein